MKPSVNCSVSGCLKSAHARTYCVTHYARWRTNGSPAIKGQNRFSGTVEERLEFYTRKSETCWEWTACLNPDGYGKITFNGKSVCAHIVSYRIANGEIPPGLCVLHKCDNRKCVRPEHLFLGTRADNNADMMKKGRNWAGKGSRNGFAKLNEEKVLQIKQLYKQGVSRKALADMFGVSAFPITEIIHNRAWKHVSVEA